MFSGNESFYSPLWHNGPKPGAFYNFPGSSSKSVPTAGFQRTSQPITTGTSVIGIKYDTGVVIAADTIVSYGKCCERNVVRARISNNSPQMEKSSNFIKQY